MGIFGTDGVRDVFGQGALTLPNLRRLGRAIGAAASGGSGTLRVLIGRDPRGSGPAIEAALASGLAAAGAQVASTGVVPTPAVSLGARSLGYDLGLVISASHNPPEYNGVKVFVAGGHKASDDLQARIEAAYEAAAEADGGDGGDGASAFVPSDGAARGAYVDALVGLGGGAGGLSGLEVAIDCAHGATGAVARQVFERLGASVHWVAEAPDGARINDGVGAMHPEACAARVREVGAPCGFSFDGDGDRVMAIDGAGTVYDGDSILFGLARALDARGALPGRVVVATILSNLGLELGLRELGITLERTPVGDRHVSRRMSEGGFALGGEQSGHIVLPLALGPTGDALACTILIAAELRDRGETLATFLGGLERCPQVQRKVRVGRKPPLDEVPAVVALRAGVEAAVAGAGRLVLRYSGTEPVLRVMVEHRDAALCARVADELVAALQGVAALR